jgi:hypothetical protein
MLELAFGEEALSRTEIYRRFLKFESRMTSNENTEYLRLFFSQKSM